MLQYQLVGRLFMDQKNKLMWSFVPKVDLDLSREFYSLMLAFMYFLYSVLTECERQRREGERMTAAGVLDVFCPECDVNGQFKPMQCDNSGCWCVYADGTKILGIGNFALTEAKCALYRKGKWRHKLQLSQNTWTSLL